MRCCSVFSGVFLLLISCCTVFCPAVSASGEAGDGRETKAIRKQPREGPEQDKRSFLARHPGYGYNGRIDELYSHEIEPRFASEPTTNHYLDSTAAQLYLNSQLEEIAQELSSGVFGNPHSASPSSVRTSKAIHEVQAQLLDLFSAQDEYELVFTRSATGALRMVGESFPWTSASAYLTTRSNHNSVLGIREHACAVGARLGATEAVEIEAWLSEVEGLVASNKTAKAALLGEQGPLTHIHTTGAGRVRMTTCRGRVPQLLQEGVTPDPVQQVVSSSQLLGAPQQQQQQQQPSSSQRRLLRQEEAAGSSPGQQDVGASSSSSSSVPPTTYSLMAYPASDNFDGQLFPLSWVDRLHNVPTTPPAAGKPGHRWLVLLDTAAFVPHHPLNLTEIKPDFAVISFYKVFGLPSGVGALLVRKEVAKLMWPRYWAGGSVFTATGSLRWHMLHLPPERLEPGTSAFLEIISLKAGLKTLAGLGGISAVHAHTKAVAEYLATRLLSLRHSSGKPVVRIYGHWQHSLYGSTPQPVQGPTVNFLVLDREGEVISYKAVGVAAAQEGIHLRWGCMCNPGSCYHAVGVTDMEIRSHGQQQAALHPGDEAWQDVWEWLTVERTDDTTGKTFNVTLPLGSIRASMGWMTRWEDAWALASFVEGYVDSVAHEEHTKLQAMLREDPGLGLVGKGCGSG